MDYGVHTHGHTDTRTPTEYTEGRETDTGGTRLMYTDARTPTEYNEGTETSTGGTRPMYTDSRSQGSGERDVDEALLSTARAYVPYLHMNGHPDCHVTCLADVPALLLCLFELLMEGPLPADMKAFGTAGEKAGTIQMIIDTLAQQLNIPMSHVTGSGIVSLDRRQMADGLHIFGDLLKHCFPPHLNTPRQHRRNEHQPDAAMTMSQLQPKLNEVASTEWQPVAEMTMNELQPKLKEVASTEWQQFIHSTPDDQSPGEFVPLSEDLDMTGSSRAGPVHEKRYRLRSTGVMPRRPSTRTFATCSKSSDKPIADCLFRPSSRNRELPYRQESVTSTDLGFHAQLKGNKTGAVDIHFKRRPQVVQVEELETTRVGHHSVHRVANGAPMSSQSRAISPIMAQSVKSTSFSSMKPIYNSDIRGIANKPGPSVTQSTRPSNRKLESHRDITGTETFTNKVRLSAKTQSTKQSGNGLSKSTSARNPTTSSCRSSNFAKSLMTAKPTNGTAQPGVKTKTATSMTAPSCTTRLTSERTLASLGKSVISRRRTSTERPSAHPSDQTVPPTSKGRRDAASDDGPGTHPPHNPRRAYPSPATRRRPAVVSTRVRKHSSSAEYRPGKHRQTAVRGVSSPQTESLCSSIKLLEEFSYVTRRLRDIDREEAEHLEAIRQLRREKARLKSVISHVTNHAELRVQNCPV